MELKLAPLLLLILVASFHNYVSAASPSAMLGNWQPISNLNDPTVVEIAQFAVSEHNKKMSTRLQVAKVVKGETQVVEGINYRLVIEANDEAMGGVAANYQAVVWDKPFAKFRQLTSFVKV